MKFKKSYLILGSLLSASVIPMVAMSCAITKTDDKKPMEVKEDKQKPGASTATPTTPSADKQGTNTPASTTPTDTSNQAGKTDAGTSGTGKAEGTDANAGKSTTDTEANGTGTGQPATPPSTGQGDNAGSADTAMSS